MSVEVARPMVRWMPALCSTKPVSPPSCTSQPSSPISLACKGPHRVIFAVLGTRASHLPANTPASITSIRRCRRGRGYGVWEWLAPLGPALPEEVGDEEEARDGADDARNQARDGEPAPLPPRVLAQAGEGERGEHDAEDGDERPGHEPDDAAHHAGDGHAVRAPGRDARRRGGPIRGPVVRRRERRRRGGGGWSRAGRVRGVPGHPAGRGACGAHRRVKDRPSLTATPPRWASRARWPRRGHPEPAPWPPAPRRWRWSRPGCKGPRTRRPLARP